MKLRRRFFNLGAHSEPSQAPPVPGAGDDMGSGRLIVSAIRERVGAYQRGFGMDMHGSFMRRVVDRPTPAHGRQAAPA